jgi:ABC-type transport system substrate-binding protein
LDPARQRELLLRAQQVLHEDAMYVGLIARRAPFGYASGLEGFAPTPWAALTWNIANWQKGRAWN